MFKISQSSNLRWEIQVSGSKNAALPILAANYILDQSEQIKLENLPYIIDVQKLKYVADYSFQNSTKWYFDLTSQEATSIRASILLIPVGLLKFWKVKFCKAGGCNIGKRPLDAFDDAFMQAWIEITNKDVKVYKVRSKPQSKIILQEFSVTTTEALLMYLAFLKDIDYEITIYNIATEPHVVNLIEFLQNLWAKIKILPNHKIVVQPSKINIRKEKFKIIWDYIEAWTFFALWSVVEDSKIVIKGVNWEDLVSMFKIAEKIGISYRILDKDIFEVNSSNKKKYQAVKLQTMIHPWFPTDLQSIFGTVLTQAKWVSKIFETLFEWRFSYLVELENLGANIEILNPHQALIIWPTKLKWGYVTTKDLRWWWALIIAWAIAKWQTYIANEDIILRWYCCIDEKLKSIWLDIEKI